MSIETEPRTETLLPDDGVAVRADATFADVLPMFEHVDAWVSVTDLATHRILYANATVRDIFGEVEGQVCWRVFRRDQGGPCNGCSVASEDAEGRPVRQRCCVDADGARRHSSVQRIPWVDGRLARLQIATGVAGRLPPQPALREEDPSPDDARRLASLEFLAGGVAHDFNNLLMGVLGHAELASMTSGDAAAIRHHLNEIIAATRRATGLTEKLLAFSGNGRLHLEPVDLSPTVARLLGELIRHVPNSIRIATRLEPDLPQIRADRLQLGLALRSAVRNAVEAVAPRPGTLQVTSRRTTLQGEAHVELGFRRPLPDGHYVLLEVEDDGPGVDEEILSSAFEPFASTRGPGRGLGLAAVDGILRSHHGAAALVNVNGRGARLTMAFPANGDLEVAEPRPVGRRPIMSDGDRRPTVLLVEDDDTVREATSAMLEILGLAVIGADNGRRALEILGRTGTRIDLVLTDAMMPELSGLEVLEAIRTTDNTIPVLLSSGFDEKDLVVGLDRLRPQGFIKKPYRFADLKEAVLTLVSH
jgi:two-component system cell cycle sensor histidine kinase/response regulator CckA